MAVVSPAKKTKMTVYVDGASRGNPGPSSVGIVFQSEDGQTIKTIGQRIGTATNNTAEYYALILALQEALMMKVAQLDVFTDSQLMAKQFSGEYKVKEDSIKRLFLLVNHLRRGFKKIMPKRNQDAADSPGVQDQRKSCRAHLY